MLPFQLVKMREIIQLQRTSVGETHIAIPFHFNLLGLLTTLIMRRHRVVEEQCLGSQAQAAGARPADGNCLCTKVNTRLRDFLNNLDHLALY